MLVLTYFIALLALATVSTASCLVTSALYSALSGQLSLHARPALLVGLVAWGLVIASWRNISFVF